MEQLKERFLQKEGNASDMENDEYVNKLKEQIASTEAELQQSFDLRQPMYEVKEIVHRLRLLLHELAGCRVHEGDSQTKTGDY